MPAASCPESEFDDAINQLYFETNMVMKNLKDSGIIPATETTEKPSYHGYNRTSSNIDYVMMHQESCQTFGISKDDLRIISQPCQEEDPSIYAQILSILSFRLLGIL